MLKDLEYTEPERTYYKKAAIHALYVGRPSRRETLRTVGHKIGRILAGMRKLNRDGKLTKEQILQAIRGVGSDGLDPWVIAELMLKMPGLENRAYEIGRKFNNDEWASVGFHLGQISPAIPMHHFPHVSTTDPLQVAYYETMDKMMAGRETRTKPGRYLTKYFSDTFTECQIKQMVEAFLLEQSPATVKFARTEAEIIRAIAEGPSDSCMSNAFHGGDHEDYSHWRGHVHPAAAYAGSDDFEVGYIENADGEVTARVICNAKKKHMARIYGDRDRLLTAMEALGYRSKTGALEGCKLRVIRNENGYGYIMPYVDAGTGSGGGALRATMTDDAKWWRLHAGSGGIDTYTGYTNNGLALTEDEDDEDMEECAECGDESSPEDTTYIESEDITVCAYCLRRNFIRAIGRRSTAFYRESDTVLCESDGNYYAANFLQNHDIYQCEVTEDWYKLDDLVMTSRGYVHVGEAIQLDVPDSDGNEYAYTPDTVETHDGRTVLSAETERRGDLLCHVNDEVTENDETQQIELT